MSDGTTNEDGFTLVEVLVAFAILTLCFGAVYQIYATGFRNLQTVEAEVVALRVAQSRLSEVVQSGSLKTGSSSGSTDGVTWRVEAMPARKNSDSSALALPDAYWVSVTVSWPSSGASGTRSLKLTTYKVLRGSP